MLYTAATVIAATLLAGVMPMLSLGNPDLQTVLKSAGRGGDASSRHRLRSALVVLEIALALALVVVAGLTVRSFIDLIDTPLGIRTEGVVASGPTTLPERNLGARVQTFGWNGTKTQWTAIVGVVRDALTRPPSPRLFVPMAQAPAAYTCALVFAPNVDPVVIGREIEEAYRATLPMVQPPRTYTVAQLLAERTWQARFATILLGTLAFIALALALSGIFGVVSFSVTQRSREFGVRIALGAKAPQILADVFRRALVTTATGAAIGLAIAAIAARAIVWQLGAVSPFDPLTFASVVALIFVSAALASLHPALRAMRVEPVEALRYE
ncbi:MAG TPA: FtsX-like permease family protein [Candidatus Acidoferrales bacterium]|nr:FtsX-like permease family protein [Candidatus Acidoferrales bacterium]